MPVLAIDHLIHSDLDVIDEVLSSFSRVKKGIFEFCAVCVGDFQCWPGC